MRSKNVKQGLARLKRFVKGVVANSEAFDSRLSAAEQNLQMIRASLPPAEERKLHMGPMFMDATINELSTKAAIVSGATHNVLSVKEAARLGLPVSPCKGWIRGPVFAWEPLAGAVRNVSLRVGPWEGLVDFMVFPIAVDAILGRDFLYCADAAISVRRNGIEIDGAFVPAAPVDYVEQALMLSLEIRLVQDEDPSTKP